MATAASLKAPIQLSHPKAAAWVTHSFCGILSLVFLTAAIAKTVRFTELESTLAASKLVPFLLVQQAGVFLLVLEYLLAFLLLLPRTRPVALHAATVLVSVFAAYSLWRWMQGIAVPCHCFGALFKMEPPHSLALNLLLLATMARLLVSRTVSAH